MACYALEMTLYLLHIDRGAKQHYPAPRAFVLGSILAAPLSQPVRVSLVESRCGAVAVGRTYLFPPLSSGGALVVRP